MDNESWIEEVINLYFRDGNVNEIEDITRKEHKEDVLKDICQVWEEKAKKLLYWKAGDGDINNQR